MSVVKSYHANTGIAGVKSRELERVSNPAVVRLLMTRDVKGCNGRRGSSRRVRQGCPAATTGGNTLTDKAAGRPFQLKEKR